MAAAARVAISQVQGSNPMTDVLISPPPFRPFPTDQPWNTYEITEFPNRFAVNFVWNRKYKGRWVYDYVVRKTRVEYFMENGAIEGYFFNYQVLKERMMKYQNEKHPEGEKCITFDLKPPYSRQWSPRSWRNIDVYDIDITHWEPIERSRQALKLTVNGVSDNYQMALVSYTNGSIERITIGKDTWEFGGFTNWDALDQYSVDQNVELQFIEPRFPCVYSGELDADYSTLMQPKLPFLFKKPERAKRGQPTQPPRFQQTNSDTDADANANKDTDTDTSSDPLSLYQAVRRQRGREGSLDPTAQDGSQLRVRVNTPYDRFEESRSEVEDEDTGERLQVGAVVQDVDYAPPGGGGQSWSDVFD